MNEGSKRKPMSEYGKYCQKMAQLKASYELPSKECGCPSGLLCSHDLGRCRQMLRVPEPANQTQLNNPGLLRDQYLRERWDPTWYNVADHCPKCGSTYGCMCPRKENNNV